MAGEQAVFADEAAIERFLEDDQHKGLLRFATAGSVDDGKSTLIGRLLYEAHGVYEDQLAAVKSSRVNRSSGAIDFSLLTDGLRAEREQGITIDVAYRYFATAKRKFIIADTPGHEQYTRNMATGASNADLAIILMDARHGVLEQSKRHAAIAALLGIPHVVVAVNKMDLVDFSETRFAEIQADFTAHLARLGVNGAHFFPISALEGDNVTTKSPRTPWYDGPDLLHFLESVPLPLSARRGPFRFAVQYVNRPNLDFRGYSGEVLLGEIRHGDAVEILPSGRISHIDRIVTWDGDLPRAVAGQAVTLTLTDEVDVSRGNMLTTPDTQPCIGRDLNAMLVWMDAEPLVPGRSYLMKQTTRHVPVKVTEIVHRLDIISLETGKASGFGMNDIGEVRVRATQPVFYDDYGTNRRTGSFILIDPITNGTVAAGMLKPAVAQASAVQAVVGVDVHSAQVTLAERIARFGSRPAILTIQSTADLKNLEAELWALGQQAFAITDVPEAVQSVVAEQLYRAGMLVLMSADNAPGVWGADVDDHFLVVPEAVTKQGFETVRVFLAEHGILPAKADYVI